MTMDDELKRVREDITRTALVVQASKCIKDSGRMHDSQCCRLESLLKKERELMEAKP